MIPTRMQVKDMFFDSKKVLAAVERSKVKALSKAGAFVRRTARSSIRKPGKTQQLETRSVKSRRGQRRRKSNEPGDRITRLQYGYAKHGLGLAVTRKMSRRDAGQMIGEAERASGIVQQIIPKSRRGKAPLNRTGTLKNNIFFGYQDITASVFVGPVRMGPATAGVLEHGGRVKITRGPNRGKTVSARNPFMKPALEKEAPKFPGLFANTLN